MATGLTFIFQGKGDSNNEPKPPITAPVYTVTWVDSRNNEILKTDTDVKADTMPSYDGEIPSSYADEEKIYGAFTGFRPALAPVTSDVTYTLTFDNIVNNLKYEWGNEGWMVTNFKDKHELDEEAIISEIYADKTGKRNSVTGIGADAFKNENNTRLKRVVIPNSIKIIGDSAFKGCSYLSLIQIDSKNSSLEQIGKEAFEYTSFPDLVIPNSVQMIGSSAFSSSGVVNVIWPKSLMLMENSIFSKCTRLISVKFPSDASLISIGDSAFYGCHDLVNIMFPRKVDRIGRQAFKDCLSLLKLDLPDSITRVGECAFSGCTSLMYMNLSKGLSELPEGFLYGCLNIPSLVLPENIKTVDSYALAECANLRVLTIEGKVCVLKENALDFKGIEPWDLALQIYLNYEDQYKTWHPKWNGNRHHFALISDWQPHGGMATEGTTLLV